MKVACLQFAPRLGRVDENIRRADNLLDQANLTSVDWLVLPEMAFSGYNFPSLTAITPHLEPTAAGPTTNWAQRTAVRLRTHITVGYPELSATGERYNSTITVSPTGAPLHNYRKHFLYYTDETWAAEGPAFFAGALGTLGPVSLGICMDLNSYRFLADWTAFEFANHVVRAQTPLVSMSMAWLTRLTPQELLELPLQPDQETLAYWAERFWPLRERQGNEAVVVVLANRCGREGEACYAGTSTVLGFRKGVVSIYDILGKCEERVLVVDLESMPKYALQAKNVPVAGEEGL